MEKIPTAYKFLTTFTDEPDDDTIYNAMIEFAKLHVQQALKDAARNVVCYNYSVDEHSILKSYPLDKIK